MRHQAVLNCKEGEPFCVSFAQGDPGWLKADNDCGRRAEPPQRRSGLFRRLQSFANLFGVEPASAAPSGAVWAVPSLDTLNRQKAQNELAEGFTVFTIGATPEMKIDADAVSLDLEVNGTPVLIEGLPADLRRRRLRPDQPLQIKFALQSLDFDGRYAGCDRIDAKVLLYKDDEPTGRPIILPLYYAALRDARQTEVATDQGKFIWSATYELARPRDPKAESQRDWRVFLTSRPRNQLDQLEKMREDIGKLNLVLTKDGQNYPVVAVVRPPLRGNSFGLALGLVQPSGQIQFTFSVDDANRLKKFAQDARRGNRTARDLISEKPDVFIELANIDRHYACAPAP